MNIQTESKLGLEKLKTKHKHGGIFSFFILLALTNGFGSLWPKGTYFTPVALGIPFQGRTFPVKTFQGSPAFFPGQYRGDRQYQRDQLNDKQTLHNQAPVLEPQPTLCKKKPHPKPRFSFFKSLYKTISQVSSYLGSWFSQTPRKSESSQAYKIEPSKKSLNFLDIIGSTDNQKETSPYQIRQTLRSLYPGISFKLHAFLDTQGITISAAQETQAPAGRPSHISNEQFLALADLMQQSQEANCPLSASEAFNLYFSISKFNQEWTQQAKLAKKPIQIEVDLKSNKAFSYVPIENEHHQAESLSRQNAAIVVLPEGSMLVNYQSKKLGQGAFKQAMRQFHLTKSLNGQLKLTPFVALTPRPSDDLKDKESDQAPREVLKAEYQTYQTIAKRLKEHPESLHADALATAHFIDLGDARSFIAQKHYDGSLKDSTWTTDQTESGKVWVLETLASLSQGLAQLHKIGLVHGDIKEENVLMDKKTGKVVLTDFGLTYDPKKEGIKGATAQYLSPGCLFCSYAKVPAFKSTLEDFQKTDIFAFGLMALHTVPSFRSDSLYYRCEAEIKDFAKKGCDQTLNQDITKSASILYSQVRKIAREACKGKSATSCKEKIIADCLNPDPALRPTAEELKRRFEQALALSQP